MSLNRKILAVIIGTLSIFLIINASLTIDRFRSHYTNALISGSMGLAYSIEGVVNEMLALGLPLDSLYGMNKRLTELQRRNPNLGYIGITDTQGKALFHSDSKLLGRVFDDAAARAVRGKTEPFWQLYDRFDGKRYYDIAVPLSDANKQLVGAIRLGFGSQIIEDKVHEAISQTLIIALLTFAGIGLLLNLFLSRSIIARIRRLSAFARAITQGDFPPQQVGGRDEIGELANSLREMGATIQGQIQALQRAGLELEERVALRTNELAQANATLEASNRELSQALSREQALSEALGESEERFRMLFEQNKAVMLILDPDSSAIIDANYAAADYYGYSREQLRQIRLSEISALSEQETQREIELARREQRDPFFFRHTLASGKVRDVEVHSGPVQWQGRTLLYAIVHDITSRKQAESKLERMAHYDALTGLPNRLLKTDRLRQAIAICRRKQTQLAVCYLDLDGFKPINDLHGHDAGDQLLVRIAQRLEESLREGDTVSRIGGDEFVL
ncbi:MAG: diguanylate cyclase, partial [Gammaproteobacteria bacterium SHHR-1]